MAGLIEKLQSSILVHLCLGISYFTSGLVINVLQCLIFIFVKPFSKRLFRTLIYYLCYSFHCRKYFSSVYKKILLSEIFVKLLSATTLDLILKLCSGFGFVDSKSLDKKIIFFIAITKLRGTKLFFDVLKHLNINKSSHNVYTKLKRCTTHPKFPLTLFHSYFRSKYFKNI